MYGMFITLMMMNGGGPPDFDFDSTPTSMKAEEEKLSTLMYAGMESEAMMIITSITQHTPKAMLDNSLKNNPLLRMAVARKAIELEILDPRETRYILAKDDEFEIDCKLVYRRYLELRDAPPISDCWRFPDRFTLSDCLQFNRAFHKNMETRMKMETDRHDGFQQIIKENDYLYKIYDLMRDAKCDFYYVTVRRNAMKKLVCMIGEEDYQKQNFPPCVPLWYFHEEK